MKYAVSVAVRGFSLIELLLVMVVASTLIVMGTGYMERRTENLRVDKQVMQMQFVLNAGLAYYVANGSWPVGVDNCQTISGTATTSLQPNFLPPVAMNSPWGQTIWICQWSTNLYGAPPYTLNVLVYEGSNAKSRALGDVIAGKLPFGTRTNSYVSTYVNIPGESLNNASAINYAGVYHHGACIPVPNCPQQTAAGSSTAMTPQVFVVPISVSGVNDNGSNNIYPISSFSAYAIGPSLSPLGCGNSSSAPACTGGTANNLYWRACLQVITERGDVAITRTDSGAAAWGQSVSLGAFTRCAISGEASGSGFTVYGD